MGRIPEGLVSVGDIARRAGLTTKALRHYDRLGLLKPVFVDAEDGYRGYSAVQVHQARLIRSLRSFDLPLDAIRTCLAADDDERTRQILTDHRAALAARSDRIRRSIHMLDGILVDNQGVRMALEAHAQPKAEPTDHRTWAVDLFNQTWTLLERESRTPEDEDRMIHMAHASRFHWGEVGGPQECAIGEWQCSRVYAVLGRFEPCLHHANRSLEWASRDDVDAWVMASAHEALARAHAVGGDAATFRDVRDRAIELANAIDDEEDRAVVIADIDSLPAI